MDATCTTLGFIPFQIIPTSSIGQYTFGNGFPTTGTYVVVKTPTVAQQLQMTKSLMKMQQTCGTEINNNDSENKPVLLRCKRRVDFSGLGCALMDSHSPSMSRRNERERRRVKMVNMGFETLRQHVPTGTKNKKMSKVETLRSAVQYIKQLQETLDAHDTPVNDLLSGVDMDALENKISEMIRNSESDNDNKNNNNIMNTERSAIINNDLILNDHFSANLNSDKVDISSGIADSLETNQPDSLSGLPQSPNTIQEHFFSTNQNRNIMISGDFGNVSSGTSTMYLRNSLSSSLHSPTSSIASDTSYDSVGHDNEDILSSPNWF